MKFLLISPKNRTVYNFRGDLIREIISAGYEVTVTGPDDTDAGKIEALGARLVVIPMNKTGTSIAGDLKYCKRLFDLIKKEKPDVTLGYTVKPVIYGSIAARLAGVSNINSMVTGGGYTFTSASLKAKLLGLVVRSLYRIGFLCADRVIFQNPDDLSEFCDKRLVKKEKCFIVNGSGVNITHFVPAEYPETTNFFMLSRLLKSKGVSEYLRAAETVKKQYPEVNFFLLGKYETEMQDAVPKEEVEAYIKNKIIQRYEETADVRPYYEQCSVYVLPSYREGTPRTVLEAMAMGRPVITTDVAGCRSTVINGKTGILVPSKNHQALAEAMISFIKNPKSIQEMGISGRQYAVEKYDVHTVNKTMMDIMHI